MANNVVHFAIHADDLVRAQRFYSVVFGWRFEAWGPPDFFRIHTGDAIHPGIEGALEKRRVALREGDAGIRAFTCTISVTDIAVTRADLIANGAKVLFEGAIPTVGKILNFEDPEGNLVAAMQYEPQHLAAMMGGGKG